MTCPGKSTACRHGHVRPYRRPLDPTRSVTLMCSDCATALNGMGMTFIEAERREVDVPVTQDRRRFVPRWLANLQAKDMTGAHR